MRRISGGGHGADAATARAIALPGREDAVKIAEPVEGALLALVSAACFVALGDRQIERFRDELNPVFPSPPRDS